MAFHRKSKPGPNYEEPTLIYDSPHRPPQVRDPNYKWPFCALCLLVWILVLTAMFLMGWAVWALVGEVMQQLGTTRYP